MIIILPSFFGNCLQKSQWVASPLVVVLYLIFFAPQKNVSGGEFLGYPLSPVNGFMEGSEAILTIAYFSDGWEKTTKQ